jgi:hypothetical protein
MSQKLEATVHGSRVEDHLRRIAPFGEDEALLMEAVNTIHRLREENAHAKRRAYGEIATECFEIAEDIAGGEPTDLENQNRQFAGERAYRVMAERFKTLASNA